MNNEDDYEEDYDVDIDEDEVNEPHCCGRCLYCLGMSESDFF